jgi:hypothetical protein
LRLFEIRGIHLGNMTDPTSAELVQVIEAVTTLWLRAGPHFTRQITPDEARTLARQLVEMADKVDERIRYVEPSGPMKYVE